MNKLVNVKKKREKGELSVLDILERMITLELVVFSSGLFFWSFVLYEAIVHHDITILTPPAVPCMLWFLIQLILYLKK